VARAIGPSVNPLQNTETWHVNIAKLAMDGEMEWCKPSSVTTFSADFSFQHLVIFGIYLNFQW
jgi:hypothetical protein